MVYENGHFRGHYFRDAMMKERVLEYKSYSDIGSLCSVESLRPTARHTTTRRVTLL